MKIIFSKHIIRDKIPLLAKKGFTITQKQIKDTIKNYDHIDPESDAPKLIASKNFDKQHVLRVVYKIEDAIIKVITVYPALLLCSKRATVEEILNTRC